MIIIPQRKIWTRQPQRNAELVALDNEARWLGVYNPGLGAHGGRTDVTHNNVTRQPATNGMASVYEGNTGSYSTLTDPKLFHTGPITLLASVYYNTLANEGQILSCQLNTGINNWFYSPYLMSIKTSGVITVGRNGSNGFCWVKSPSGVSNPGIHHTIAVIANSSTIDQHVDVNNTRYYVNGAKYSAEADYIIGSGNIEAGAGTDLRIGNTQQFSSLAFAGQIFGLGIISGIVSDNLAKRLSLGMHEWYKPATRKIFLLDAGGSSAVLEANAQTTATATGALTTDIQITGAAASVSTATGSLTTAIPLSGSAASVSVADGLLTTQIRLSGDAIMQALATGSLEASSASLAADGSSTVTATGQLTTEIRLSGAAIMEALATAGLTTSPLGLSADAIASASASANLTTGIPLLADASAIAIGSAGLTTGIQLSAAAASVSNATGDLTVTLSPGMSAAAFAEAIASGTLSTQIQLSAAATMQTLATASLVSAWLVDSQLQRSLFFRRRANQYFFRRS